MCLPVISWAGEIPVINITDKTNPEITELYKQYQDIQGKIDQIQSERVDKLGDNYKALKENEQSLENRTLTATTTAATGAGGMELAQGLAEQKADKTAEQSMTNYIATMRCKYGDTQVKAGLEEIELPGGNDSEMANLRNEYFALAADLKERKAALGMKPGIESEEILDKSEMGLYTQENIGISDGAYASLYRAQMYNSEKDKQEIDAAKESAENRVVGGATAAGAGVVAGVVGNATINKNAPKERSKEINREYDKKIAEISKERNSLEQQLNQAIAKNAAQVKQYNDKLKQHQNLVAKIRQAPSECQELFAVYVDEISELSPIENETDVVDTELPDMDGKSELLTQCANCVKKGMIFDAETYECSCPSDTPIEKDGRCVSIGDAMEFDDSLLDENEEISFDDLPKEVRMHEMGIDFDDDLSNEEQSDDTIFDSVSSLTGASKQRAEGEEEMSAETNGETSDETENSENENTDDKSEYCLPVYDEKGNLLKHGLKSIDEHTKIGDFCSSPIITSGKIFRRKNGTCSCLAFACKGDKYEVKNGKCTEKIINCESKEYTGTNDKSKYPRSKVVPVDNRDKALQFCKEQAAGKCNMVKAIYYRGPKGRILCNPPEAEYDKAVEEYAERNQKYYHCCEAKQVPNGIDCKCVDKFSGYKVTPTEADGLMKELARRTYRDNDIRCKDQKSFHGHHDNKIKVLQCASKNNDKRFYEFAFKSLDSGNNGFYDALCSMWGLKAVSGQAACKDATDAQCKEISTVVDRRFFPGGSAKITDSGIYIGSRAISKSKQCTINEHPVATSGTVALVNKTLTMEDLRTVGSVNPLYFYDKGQQVNANSDVYKVIENYLFVEQKLPVKQFRCGASFVDNTNYYNGSRKQFNEQNEKQRKCIEDSQKFSGGGEHAAQSYGGVVSGCRRQYPVDLKTGDLLTCEYNGQKIDFLFKKLDAIWDRKSTGGYQALRCLSEGGSFTGKSCAVADKAKCDEFNARFMKDYPDSKGMEWDKDLQTCILKDARHVARVQKVAEVSGNVALTLLSSIAGGPIVWGLAAVETGALITEAATESKISDWAEQFLIDANKCVDNSKCANNVLKKHIARIDKGSNQFSDSQNHQIARQIQRLIEMLDADTVSAIIDKGNTDGYIGEDRDPDLEKSIESYYGTELSKSDKALLVTKKIATVATFATLAGAVTTAGMRIAVKKNWLKVSNARAAKWIDWRILKIEDVSPEVAAMSKLGQKAGIKAADAVNDVSKAADKATVEMTSPQAKKLEELDADIAKLESKTNRTEEEANKLKKLHQERNELKNKIGTKDADELAKAQSVAFDKKAVETAQTEYETAKKRYDYVKKYMAEHNGNPPKNVSKQELQQINDNMANAEKKLKDLGQDVTPAEPLKIGQKPTTAAPESKSVESGAKPKETSGEAKPKETETPKGTTEPTPKKPVEETPTNISDIRQKAGTDPQVENIKYSGGELRIPKNKLSDEEWELLRKDLLEKDNLVMTTAKDGSVVIHPDINTLKTKASKNFDEYLKQCKSGGECVGLPISRLSDAEWRQLNAYAKDQGMALFERKIKNPKTGKYEHVMQFDNFDVPGIKKRYSILDDGISNTQVPISSKSTANTTPTSTTTKRANSTAKNTTSSTKTKQSSPLYKLEDMYEQKLSDDVLTLQQSQGMEQKVKAYDDMFNRAKQTLSPEEYENFEILAGLERQRIDLELNIAEKEKNLTTAFRDKQTVDMYLQDEKQLLAQTEQLMNGLKKSYPQAGKVFDANVSTIDDAKYVIFKSNDLAMQKKVDMITELNKTIDQKSLRASIQNFKDNIIAGFPKSLYDRAKNWQNMSLDQRKVLLAETQTYLQKVQGCSGVKCEVKFESVAEIGGGASYGDGVLKISDNGVLKESNFNEVFRTMVHENVHLGQEAGVRLNEDLVNLSQKNYVPAVFDITANKMNPLEVEAYTTENMFGNILDEIARYHNW